MKKHPCFSKKAHHKFGRIHLPVAPACNIQCRYCIRKYDCANESRPGITSTVISPRDAEEALQYYRILPSIKDKLIFAENVRQVLDYVARGERFHQIRERHAVR